MEHFWHNIQGWFTFPDFYTSMVERFDSGATFVEVGVWKGQSIAYMAVEIINSGKDIKIYAVDTFEGSGEHRWKEGPHYEPLLETKDGLVNHFLENIKPVAHVVIPFRRTSQVASNLFGSKSVDFVFIDAAHDYESVKQDIEAWLPKVKDTGVLSGHDINDWQVEKAVKEVLGEYKTMGDVWWVEVGN